MFLLCVSTLSFGASLSIEKAGFDNLTESEKAEIIKLVADKSREKSILVKNDSIKPDDVEKWVKIGSNIGLGLSSAAKELGIAVNDFAGTTVGKMTMMLIFWYIMGSTIVHFIGGILVWIIGFTAIRYLMKRAYTTQIEYDLENKNIFGNYIIKKVNQDRMTSEGVFGWVCINAGVLIAGLVCIFTF